jgi:predicted DNA binding CopG/RHH family protein
MVTPSEKSVEEASMCLALRYLPHSPRKLQAVYTRLFEADVEELKRRARLDGVPWQQALRILVRDALRAKTGGVL